MASEGPADLNILTEEEEKKEEVEAGAPKLTDVPHFNVNLDDDPSERWNEVIDAYKSEFKRVRKVINDTVIDGLGTVGLALKSVVTGTLKRLSGMVYYEKELNAISKRCGMPLGELILMQLIYEASACCTSIVAADKSGMPVLIRSMDWEMDFLRPLTIEVTFSRGKLALCKCTTWAGYVGILTGMTLNCETGFAVAVNFRLTDEGGYWSNFTKAIGGGWPIGFLVRETLLDYDNGVPSYERTKKWLSNSKTIAPTYFTVAGAKANQGCIVTRDRTEIVVNPDYDNPLNLDAINQRFLIQTNMDYWDNNAENSIMWSISRRRKANTILSDYYNKGEGGATFDQLWRLLSEAPIFNEITVYGTLMSPVNGSLETRLPDPFYAFEALPDNYETHAKAEWKTCRVCDTSFHPQLNCKGDCLHSGDWHDEFSKCELMKCARGLGVSRIGMQHWSCCYSTTFDTICPSSPLHQATS